MSSPFATDVDCKVALAIDGKWTDISTSVAFEEGIGIQRGSDFDTPRLEASEGGLMLLPSSGRFMRLNPESDLYGKLMMDQPMRVDRYYMQQDFSVDASNGWSNATECGRSVAWSTYGVGGTVAASDWSVSGGAGRMLIPAATAQRLVYLNVPRWRNGEIVVSFTMSQANITGGAVGASLILRGQDATLEGGYMACDVYINPDESVQVFAGAGGYTVPADFPADTDIVHSGQKIWVVGGVDDDSIYMKAWTGTLADEPVEWQHVGDGSYFGAGFIGLQGWRYSGNTNTNLSVAFDDFYFRQPRIVGVVPDWSPRWDKTGKFEHTPLKISGIVRRLENDETPVESPLKTSLPSTEGLVAYWSCEDERGAQSFASSLPNNAAGPMTWIADAGQPGPNPASYSGFVASKPIPTVGKSRWRGSVPEHTETGIQHVRFLAHFPSSDMDNLAIIQQLYVTGTSCRWELKYLTGGGVQLDAYDRNDVNILASGPFSYNLKDKKVRFAVQLEQVGGNVSWLVGFIEEGNTLLTQNGGTLVGYTVGRVFDVRYAVGNPTVNYGDLAIGHVTVSNMDTEIDDMYRPFNGFEGELDWERAARVCAQEGIDFRLVADPNKTLFSARMGPQPIAKPVDVLNECADVGQNAIYETRSVHNGITLRLHHKLRNQDKQLELSLADHELTESLEPSDDPDRRFNDITAKKTEGSSYRAQQTEGPFATDVIGTRPRGYPANPELDDSLRDIAYFQMVRNTIDEYLYEKVSSSLDISVIRADHDKCRKMLDLQLYDRMIVRDGENRKLFNEIEQLPRGYTEKLLPPFSHEFTWNTTPGSPYLGLELGDSEYSSLTSRATALLSDLNTTDTTFSITRQPGEPMWSTTTPPSKIMIGGERMVLSSVGNPPTPSFVSAGTAAHADNANVVPGLPAGATTGDTLIVYCGLRTNTMTTAITGYTLVGNVGNVQIWVKTHTGSEVAPTVVVGGGAAGATVSAQMCALRNIGPFPVYANAQANGSTQNIAAPGDYEPQATWVAIQFGWKQDDWTGVTPPQFMTEIGEPSSTLGNDQGITWAYKIGTDHVDVGSGTFTVTGGASATNVGVIMVWGTRQTMTVVRSDNNVVKEHKANAPITAWREVYLGLGNA